MKMQEIFEQDIEKLTAELQRAKTPEKCAALCDAELERILYRTNETCPSERMRAMAADQIQIARAMLPMLDAVKETKVWELKNTDSSATDKNGGVFTALGCSLLALSVLLALLLHPFGAAASVIPSTACALGVGGCLFLSGEYRGSRHAFQGKTPVYKTENIIDEKRYLRTMKMMLITADQSLERLEAEERYEQEAERLETAGEGALSSAELELAADLLEASVSEDGEFALERLKRLPYYLHCKGIETVDYTEETAAMFDKMPGTQTRTLRPALVADGVVVKKGLAAGGS